MVGLPLFSPKVWCVPVSPQVVRPAPPPSLGMKQFYVVLVGGAGCHTRVHLRTPPDQVGMVRVVWARVVGGGGCGHVPSAKDAPPALL